LKKVASVLKEVLRAIEGGEVTRKEELAAKMGVSVSTIDGILDFLVKKGYLKVTGDTRPARCDCQHCGVQSFCIGSGTTYEVTEKGKMLA
jgi:DNA-binding MarR family transcriptional regulator